MIHSIAQLIENAKKGPQATLAVACAHDRDVLRAVCAAHKEGVARSILVGAAGQIRSLLGELGARESDFAIEDAPDDTQAARRAVELVRAGRAGFLMKGLLPTSELMRAVVDKENGLRTGRLLSHVMMYETDSYPRPLFLTDGGMNTYPDLDKKAGILENAALCLRALGYERIYAACVCGAEEVNPKIQATVDARALSEMEERWKPYNMTVSGPMGLDLAVSRAACEHKHYQGAAGGRADILLVPTYEVGNGIGKALTYFAGARSAGIVVGASAPVVLVSRADPAETKLASIALGCAVAGAFNK